MTDLKFAFRQLLKAPGFSLVVVLSLAVGIGANAVVFTWIRATLLNAIPLAMIDPDYVEFGKEVTLVWGEPNGGTSKPTVEPHVQTEIKAIVSPVPYSSVARNNYADSWRAKGVGTNA